MMQQRYHKRSGSAATIIGQGLIALIWAVPACHAQAPTHKWKPQAAQFTCGPPSAKKAHFSSKKNPPHKPTISPDMVFLQYLPPWNDFRCAPYVDAAVRLQALGKDRACRDLRQLAKWEDHFPQVDEARGYRAITLCRMLFVPKAGKRFRSASIGKFTLLAGSSSTDWPLEPIALIGQVPFLISAGMPQADFAEWSISYVAYCMSNCDWSSIEYHSVTQQQEEQALQKLDALPVWKGGLSDDDKAFFARQIAPLTKQTENKND